MDQLRCLTSAFKQKKHLILWYSGIDLITTKARRELVNERTSTQNHIRVHRDHIFREFQGKSVLIDGKRKHIEPFYKLFGKASRYIMRNYPHPSNILKLGDTRSSDGCCYFCFIIGCKKGRKKSFLGGLRLIV